MAKINGYLANSSGKIGNLTIYHNSTNGTLYSGDISKTAGGFSLG